MHISFDFTKNSDSVDIEIQDYGTFWPLNVRYLCILKDHVILFLNITDNITTLREREFIL